jgi:hypothetical protein
MSAPSRVRSWPHYVVGIGLHTAIFVAVGPLVGSLVFSLVLGLLSAGVGAGMATMAAIVAIYPLIVVGYVWAWKPALLTGVVVGAGVPFIDDAKRVYLLAVIVGIISSLVFILTDWDARPSVSAPPVAIVLAGAVAAATCTWIALKLPRAAEGVEEGVK